MLTHCFGLQEFNLGKMTKWIDNEDEKSELLQFIDEMKEISDRKSTKMNPLLTKNFNASDSLNKSNTNISYEELLLFDQILSAEIYKNTTNGARNNIDRNRINQTSQSITEMNENAQSTEWNSDQQQESIKIEDVIKPAEKQTQPKIFDPQNLIERIRKTPHRLYETTNNELLTCKSQSFLQRLAVLGEILT